MIIGSIFVALAACSGGDDGGGGGVDSISETIPTTVVLSSPTASTAVGGGGMVLATRRGFKAAVTSDYDTKVEELVALASGLGECTFTGEAFQTTLAFANGFGPNVGYQNNPGQPANPNWVYGGGDLGIWNSTSTDGVATSAAQMNKVIEFAASYVDNVINMMGAIACAGVKGGKTPPAVGESIDLSTVISSFVSITGFTFTSASIERLADDGSNPVYQLSIAGTVDVGGTAHDFTIVVKHEPTATDNSTFKGKIAYKMITETMVQPGNCQDFAAVAAPGGIYAGTIVYEQASASDLKYEINGAEFCGAGTNPFDSNYDIDPTDVISATNPDGWANNYIFDRLNIDPTRNGAGIVTSAWMAGYGGEAARTVNVATSQVTDGSATGDGYFGYGPPIQTADAATIGLITGIQCNWGGGVSQQLVQHQGLARAVGATIFAPVAGDEQITFAPADTCSYAGGAGYVYSSSFDSVTYAPTANAMSNDNMNGDPVTNDLIPLATYQARFTAPTAPSGL